MGLLGFCEIYARLHPTQVRAYGKYYPTTIKHPVNQQSSLKKYPLKILQMTQKETQIFFTKNPYFIPTFQIPKYADKQQQFW